MTYQDRVNVKQARDRKKALKALGFKLRPLSRLEKMQDAEVRTRPAK
jgi:hypothetical protein